MLELETIVGIAREFLSAHAGPALALGGLLIGAWFGFVVQRTDFCTMGAVSDLVNLGDARRWRSWLLATATAVIATQWLARSGVVDLSRSMYLSPNLSLGGHILGGLLMGIGMVFAGGCPSRNLARAGAGDLRALLVLVVIGITAFMAIGGALGWLRNEFDLATQISLARTGAPTQSLADLARAAFGMAPWLARASATAVLAGALLGYCFMDHHFRTSPRHVLAGVGVGVAVTAGWILTGLAYDDLAATPVIPQSLTFVRPAGDTLDWLERATALGWPGFGPASFVGGILGAGLSAVARAQFKLKTFADVDDTVRSLGGAMLMGVGGVLALGCTVGQGITGVSTLALGSIITFAAIVAGAIAGFKLLERMI